MLPKFSFRQNNQTSKHFQNYFHLHTRNIDDDDDLGAFPEKKAAGWKIYPIFTGTGQTSRIFCKSAVMIYIVISSCLLAFLIINIYITRSSDTRSQPNQSVKIAPCGNSSTHARANGCYFDIISFSWVPAQCYDSELAAEFKALTDWSYYLDRNKTQPITQDLALTGEFAGLYTEFEYHLRHCTYLWKKMHRAILGRGKQSIDSVTGGYMHTEHCTHMLMTRREISLNVVNAVIMVKFPDCGVA